MSDLKQTDLSKRLRKFHGATPLATTLMRDAAEEIERYYTGMLNWKATAEAQGRTQPEAAAPGDPAPIYKYHDDGKVTLANSDKIPSYRTAPAPEPEFICEITEGTVRINPYGDEPIISGKRTYTVNIPAAQDLSAAILALPCDKRVDDFQSPLDCNLYVLGFIAAKDAAAALASSANALSAGDRVDALRYRWLREKGYGMPKQEEELDAAIDAAILQSQNGDSHG